MIGTRNAKHRILLQDRDRIIIALLDTLRVATRQQISSFCGFHSDSRANARLSQLLRAGQIGRDFIGTITGGRLAVYFPYGRRPRSRNGPAGFEAAITHSLDIGEVYLSLRRALEGLGWLFSWDRPKEPLGPAGVIPDALIRLEASGKRWTFLLEVDRATEGAGIWKAKIAKYLALARYPELRDLLGDERFGVLVVVPSDKRLAQLRALISGQTRKIFWISTTQAINRGGFLASVWLRPEGERRLPLLGGI